MNNDLLTRLMERKQQFDDAHPELRNDMPTDSHTIIARQGKCDACNMLGWTY